MIFRHVFSFLRLHITGPDPYGFLDRHNEDLSVADLSRPGRPCQGRDQIINILVVNNDLEFDFWPARRDACSGSLREACSRERGHALGHLFRRARRDEAPAVLAPFRPEVDHGIGRLDDVEVVLDDDDRVALVDQLVQHVEQLARVLEVQPGRRLVEDVERPAGAAARQLLRQLDALRLAAAERRRRLPELDVAEADFLQRAQLVGDRREVLEQLAAPGPPSGRARRRSTCRGTGSRASRGCSAAPCTPRTSRRRSGRKCISIGDHAVALARLAAPALHVEREPARPEPARLAPRAASANRSRMNVKRPV